MKINKFVSIIIPTFNREKTVINCINSLLNIDFEDFEIIIIDDASKDDTEIRIKECFSGNKKIRYFRLNNNCGVAVARNEGIKHANGDWLCFVDSDNIVDKHFLEELLNLAYSDEKIGFVGPKMCYLNDPKRIWYAGAEINLLTSKTHYIGVNEIDKGQHDQIREVGHIPNVSLIKRDVIKDIGLFDFTYFTTYEESDLAMRAKRSGYKVIFCPTAVVYHDIKSPMHSRELRSLIGFDTQFRAYYAARNRPLFMKKFADKLNFVLFLLIFNNLFLLYYCSFFLFYGKVDLLKAYIKGYLSGIKEIKMLRTVHASSRVNL